MEYKTIRVVGLADPELNDLLSGGYMVVSMCHIGDYNRDGEIEPVVQYLLLRHNLVEEAPKNNKREPMAMKG